MNNVIVIDDSKWYEKFNTHGPVINQRLMDNISRPLRWKPINEFYYGSASRNFEDAALFAIKVDKDLTQARKYFYYSELCKVRQYLEFTKGATSIMDAALPNFFKTPLSGAKHLYPFFAKMRLPQASASKKAPSILIMRRFYATLQQAAMVKDLNWLAKELEGFEIACANEPKVDNAAIIDFYRALVDNNADGVEQALMAQLEPKSFKRRQREFASIPGRFMAWLTMWCAKVAWINGHEVEIDHPFIISELLPDRTPVDDFQSENKPFPFLIDPVLDGCDSCLYDFWHYGGEHSDEDVELHNKAIFHTLIPAEYDGVENFVNLPPDPR